MATYFFPTDNSRARAVSIVPFTASGIPGVLLPLWPNPETWFYDGTALEVSGMYGVGGPYNVGQYNTGPYPSPSLGSMCGFGSAASDTSGNAWLTQYTGSLVFQVSGGSYTVYALPSGSAFVGTAFCTGFGHVYTVNNAGNIYTQQGTGVVFVGSYYPSGGAVYGTGYYGSGVYSSFAINVSSVWALACSGNSLFSFAPSTLLEFQLSSSTTGSGIPITAPMATPLCIAATGGWVVLGGWSQATIGSGGSGITQLAFDTVNSNAMALRPASSRVDLYTGVSETWIPTQSLSGITTPSYGAWDNDGTHAVVSDPVSGAVYGLSLTLSTLSIVSTTTGVTNASAITIQPDDITSFVCQPSQNQVRQLNLVGINWVVSSAFSLTGASTVQSLTIPFEVAEGFTVPLSGVAVGYSSGVAFLTGNGQSYNITHQVPLTYTPTSLALDFNGNVIACGTSGSLGILTPFTGYSSGASVNWTGNAANMIYLQGQAVVLDSVNELYRYFSYYTGSPYSQYNTQPFFVSGVSGAGIFVSPQTANASGGTVFLTTSGANSIVYMSHFVGPFNLSPVASGTVAIYSSGGTWTSVVIAERDVPTALAFDSSGHIQVATRGDNLYAITTAGSTLGASGITLYNRQVQGTPLGISALTFTLGHMWGASSLNGALVELF